MKDTFLKIKDRLTGTKRPKEDNAEAIGSIALQQELTEAGSRRYELFGADDKDGFVVGLRALRDFLDLPDDPKVVYPGSSTHVGVAYVFGKNNVTHVDPEKGACESLEAAGYHTRVCGIEDYHPDEKADLMIALNSYGEATSVMVREVMEPGGLVISNNYTGWAVDLSKLDNVTLIAAMLPAYGEDASIVTGSDIPPDATGSTDITYRVSKEGKMITSQGSPDAFLTSDPYATEFTEASPNYPDALFVFRVN